MEMEPTSPSLAKKLWKVVRICTIMLRKEITKSKQMLDLNALFKKGKLVSKTMGHAMLHRQYTTMGCRSTDVQLSYAPSKEYEFSCSDTPKYTGLNYRKKNHQHNHYSRRTSDVNMVKNISDMLPNYEAPVEASPLVVLPEFGVSPKVRQLRISDSPFALKGEEKEDGQVDKMAEEFITKFYKDLKNQKRVAALQSPSPYRMWNS